MKKLTGYAVHFDDWSLIAGSFWERVRPGAFSKALRSDREIHLIHHHDYKTVLATTRNGTLKLHEDSKGLYFEAELPDTTPARDLAELIKLRTIRGMSFGFLINGADGEDWRERKNGVPERDLLDLKLNEITVTPIPAYKKTSVSLRSKATKSQKRANSIVKKRLMEKSLMLREIKMRQRA